MIESRTLPEVHVAAAIFRRLSSPSSPTPSWHLLLCRRASTRAYFPGLWEGCGGRLQPPNETFGEAVRRHCLEELGLVVLPGYGASPYSFQGNAGVIPGVRIACLTNDDPKLIPERHSEFRWAPVWRLHEIDQADTIPGLLEQSRILGGWLP